MATINATKPWEIIAVKLQNPFIRSLNGHTQLLVIQDKFTKRVEIYSLKQATASEICRVLKKELIYQFGCPKTIITSNGTQFTSRKFQKLLKYFGIRHVATPPYFAQHKGVGRTNKVLKTMVLQHDKKSYQSSNRNLAKRKFASNESTKVRQVYPKYNRKTLPLNTIPSTLEEINRSRHLQDDKVLASGKQKKYYSKNRRKRIPGIENMVTKKEYLSAAANHCAAKLAPRYNGSLIGLKMYADKVGVVCNKGNTPVRNFGT
ncbi:uncharacterized protein [Chelonus insularis]|uniref:uncharacterized protein n=1 Tax=Chelonus insularis TaxID=460826 RepID=UPI00158A2F9D|nr:uncharacterized protein LOC118065463 [Chelonus insularis]